MRTQVRRMDMLHTAVSITKRISANIFIIGYLLVVSSKGASQGNTEYCELEVFEKSCPEKEMIMMTSAYFGRMALGRCITQDYGIGCKADVLSIMDGFCSGRRSCSVNTINPALMSVKAKVCPRDVTAYLLPTYECVKVLQLNVQECQTSGYTVYTGATGHISSLVNVNSPCKYRLSLSQGRKLNITTLNFPPPPSIDKSSISSSACYEVGSISEGGKSRTIHKCLNDPRHKQLYLSDGGQVDINIPYKESHVAGHFIIQFEATGCGDPNIPDDSEIQRTGLKAKITCKNSNQFWDLSCDDGTWKGDIGKCTSIVSGWSFLGLFDHQHPYGTAIVVGIGATLGVLTGGILLYIIIAIFKRCQKSDYVMTYEYTDPSFAHIPTDYHADKSNLLLQDDKLFEQNSNTWGSQSHGNSNTLGRGGTDHSRVPLPPLPNENNTLSYEKPLYNRNGNV